jgi:hypothetical protein
MAANPRKIAKNLSEIATLAAHGMRHPKYGRRTNNQILTRPGKLKLVNKRGLLCTGVSHENMASFKEQLLVSKALPVFGTPYSFCACSYLSLYTRLPISIRNLKFKAFSFSLVVSVSQFLISIRLCLEIFRCPRSLSPLVGARTRRHSFTTLIYTHR